MSSGGSSKKMDTLYIVIALIVLVFLIWMLL